MPSDINRLHATAAATACQIGAAIESVCVPAACQTTLSGQDAETATGTICQASENHNDLSAHDWLP